ncbi:hypothetical protein D3C78_1524780 [compost metagenome]
MYSFMVPLTDEEKRIKWNELRDGYNTLETQICDLGKSINQLLLELDALTEDLNNSNNIAVSNRLVEIDKLWFSITEEKIFETVYSYALKNHIDNYMRHINEIVETKEIFRKSLLIVDHLGVLVSEMNNCAPMLLETLRDAITHLDSLLNEMSEINQ